MKDNLVVFFGGKSVEHDISIITALTVMKNINLSDYNVLPVYISGDGLWYMADNLTDENIYQNFDKFVKNKVCVTLVMGKPYLAIRKGNKYSKFIQVNCALLCNHGMNGEDGTLQGVLELCSIPYTSCGVTSSGICMDKVFMKNIFVANKIPTTEYMYLKENEYIKDEKKILLTISKRLKFPIIIKPANLGSSIGISVCNSIEDLKNGIDVAFKFDSKILIEKVVISLKEYNCACLKVEDRLILSSIDEVESNDEIFSFDEKYLQVKAKRKNKISASMKNRIHTLTSKVYELFDCEGIVRVDFLFDESNNILYVNEINSIPGSMALYLFKDYKPSELIECMILQAKFRLKDKFKRKYSFESQALNIFKDFKNSNKFSKK